MAGSSVPAQRPLPPGAGTPGEVARPSEGDRSTAEAALAGRPAGAEQSWLSGPAQPFDQAELTSAWALLGRLTAIVDRAPVGLALLDSDLRYVLVNDQMARFTGRLPADHVGQRVEDLIVDLPSPVQEACRAVLVTGEPVTGQELSFPAAPDQPSRHFLCGYYPVPNPAGGRVELGCVVVEVTAQREAAAERDRLVAQLRDEARIIETLHRAGSTLTAELDQQRVVQAVTDAATELSGAQFGAFFHNVVDADGESFLLYTLSGSPREAFAGFPMPRNTAIFGPTFAGEGIVRIADVTADSRYGGNPPYYGMPMGHPPVRSYLAVPVISRTGEVIGGLFFGHAEAGVFGEREERLVAGIAPQAAVAVDNARLYAAEQQARAAAEQDRAAAEQARAAAEEAVDRLALLQRITAELSEASDLAEVAQTVVSHAATGVGASCAMLMAVSEDGASFRVVTATGFAAEVVEQFHSFPVSAPMPAGDVLRSGRPLLWSSLADRDAHYPQFIGYPVHQQSYAFIPLLREGQRLGVVCYGWEDPRRFSDGDAQFLLSVGQQCAQALDRARLHEAERAAARRNRELALTLQRSLLPGSLPAVDGLAVAYRYAAGTDTEVGGDWFDVLPLPAGRAGIVIGDVMGRGVRAAAVMGQLRATVRAYAAMDLPPDELLTHLDSQVQALDEVQIVTCVYAILDPLTGWCSLANAGHLPPILLEPDGGTRVLATPTGIPLGVGGSSFEAITVQLPPGGGLVLYTDGLVESRTSGLDEGIATLSELLSAGAGDPAATDPAATDPAAAGDPGQPAVGGRDLEGLCDLVLARLEPVGGFDDDVAILAMRTDPARDPTRVAHLRLSPHPAAVSQARAFTQATLAGWTQAAGSVGGTCDPGPDHGLHEGVTVAGHASRRPADVEPAGAPEEVDHDLACLLVSELVTNAIRHAAGEVELRLRRGARTVSAEVHDDDTRLPRLRQAREDDEGGRGLYLVNALAGRWGTRPAPDGKVVWFELTG